MLIASTITLYTSQNNSILHNIELVNQQELLYKKTLQPFKLNDSVRNKELLYGIQPQTPNRPKITSKIISYTYVQIKQGI